MMGFRSAALALLWLLASSSAAAQEAEVCGGGVCGEAAAHDATSLLQLPGRPPLDPPAAVQEDASGPAPPQLHRYPIVIDTDADVDDLMGISYLLTDPRIEVKAILLSADAWSNQWAGVVNVMRLTQFFGCPKLPVAFMDGYLGKTQLNFEYPNGLPPQNMLDPIDTFFPGACNLSWNPNPPAWQSASQLLLQVLKESSTKVDIIELGALTNLAAALHEDSQLFLSKVRTLYMSGGQVVPLYPENSEWQVKPYQRFPYRAGPEPYGPPPEATSFTGKPSKPNVWNVFADPISASQVFSSGVDLVISSYASQHEVYLNESHPSMYLKQNCDKEVADLITNMTTEYGPWTNQKTEDLHYWDAQAAVLMSELLPTAGKGTASSCKNFSTDHFVVDLEAGPWYGRLIKRTSGPKARSCLHLNGEKSFLETYYGGVCRRAYCPRGQ